MRRGSVGGVIVRGADGKAAARESSDVNLRGMPGRGQRRPEQYSVDSNSLRGITASV